jgi:uncharacterized protein
MKLWTVFLVTCLAALNGYCDELTPAKRNDIRLVMQETGIANMGVQMINRMIPLITQNLSSSHPEIPAKTLEKIGGNLAFMMTRKISTPGGMIDLLVPIYANHFTHAEIKQLLAFYRSDLGKKVINKLPLVMSESIEVGKTWGSSLEPNIKSVVDQALAEDKVVLNRK